MNRLYNRPIKSSKIGHGILNGNATLNRPEFGRLIDNVKIASARTSSGLE